MYIKWKYNDHGHPDFKVVEIPDDLDGYETVEDYICEMNWVPTWSERFMVDRIKWSKVTLTNEELIERLKTKIKGREIQLEADKKHIESLKKELNELNVVDKPAETK